MKRIWLSFVVLIVLVLASSWFVTGLWGGKAEKITLPQTLVFTPGETVGAFLERNKIPEAVMAEALGKDAGKVGQDAPLASLSLPHDQLQAKLQKAAALASEHATKEWQKIFPKFVLWAIALFAAYKAVTKGQLNRRTRKWYYLGAVVVFGVALGSDPSPMGTVKDAMVLLAKDGVVFPPRLIALAVFLLTVVLANKAICSWGCQLGVLQDLVFRLNRNKADTAGVMKQVKVPFALSNGIRIAFFLVFTAIVFAMGLDIIEYVDPFKTFNPAHLGIAGAITVGLLLVASLFVYRPWCHFACPFGLVGWLLERFSLSRIRVDEQACTSCGACERACPTDVMGAILKKKAVIPDCFACGTCTEVCPTKAVRFRTKNG